MLVSINLRCGCLIMARRPCFPVVALCNLQAGRAFRVYIRERGSVVVRTCIWQGTGNDYNRHEYTYIYIYYIVRKAHVSVPVQIGVELWNRLLLICSGDSLACTSERKYPNSSNIAKGANQVHQVSPGRQRLRPELHSKPSGSVGNYIRNFI